MQGTIHLQYKTHAASVSHSEDGNIVCFKHNAKLCDFEIFSPNHIEALSEYMLTPLPDGIWGFQEDN